MLENKIPHNTSENVFLIDKESNKPVPLLRANFEVEISMGYADMVLH